jgi:hypothetical protein
MWFFLVPFILGILTGMYQEIKKSIDYNIELEAAYKKDKEHQEQLENEIDNEIAMLEENIRKRKIIAYELELELETVTNQKRKHVILSKLISLDNATYKDNKKIDKLMEKLE